MIELKDWLDIRIYSFCIADDKFSLDEGRRDLKLIEFFWLVYCWVCQIEL